jgi:hypothetical protein
LSNVYLRIYFGLSIFFIGNLTQAQIIPANQSTLTYTDIVFEYPAVENAHYYLLAFKYKGHKQYFHQQVDSTQVSFCNLFRFGGNYTWNYQVFDKQNISLYTSPDYQFSITNSRSYDTLNYSNLIRGNYDGKGYLMIDKSQNMITWDGKEVWRMPVFKNLPIVSENNMDIRDLRMTRSGTFTTIITKPSVALEFDRDGNILWIAPESQIAKEKTKEKYHHDFRKLENGNYMVMSETEEMIPLPWNKELYGTLIGLPNIIEKKNKLFITGIFGTLLEYSPDNKLVWKWNSSDYVTERVLDGWIPEGMHANAFYYDEVNNHIYFSMKDISLIIKIDKSTGKAIDSFGAQLSPNQKISSINTFLLQHSIEKTTSGDLLLFNNSNIEADSTAHSSLVIINDVSTNSLNERIVKTVSCLIDNNDDGKSIKFGSSEELPDGNILIGNGAKGRIIIIDPRDNYRIIQDIVMKSYQRKIWDPMTFYRCHYAPSLYPNYFSVNKSKEGIKITNEGSEKDSYSIEFILKDGSKKTIQSNVIYSDDTFFQPFELSTVSAVNVVSTSNTRFKRSLSW